MHILHVYEVSTALNNKETVLDQEHHSTAPKETKKVQFWKSHYFLKILYGAAQNAIGVKKNFQNILTWAHL